MQTAQSIKEDQQTWLEIIRPKSNALDFKIKDIWRYKDLLILLVRRDFIATYKQTILGPLWFFLQPILTTIMFALVFGRIAGIPTDGIPMILFYLSGLTLWNYFSECLNKTATVLKDNAEIFGKVYFPRIIMPLSIIVSNLIKLSIQLILFLLIWAYYLIAGSILHPNIAMLLLPVLIIMMGGLGLGLGMIITSMTTKYRDLVFLLTFGVQLLMYATPVIYPLSNINNHTLRLLIMANPMTSIIETFRYAFLGSGRLDLLALVYSAGFMIAALIIGILVFNKVEKSFMDTV
jgi:lipopolysaccharide transport system permease protein